MTKGRLGRRGFLRNAAIGGAAAFARAESAPQPDSTPGARPGSDFMLDVLKSIGFEFVCANPGSSFKGLHESLINYGGNRDPEFITCCHEESAVAMAHGYAKIEGRPLCVFAHGTVGLQHAAMAIYNAYCDRVPVFIVAGNTVDALKRSPGDWVHSVQDAAAMLRDFVKWDDLPASLGHFAESAVRAYQIAMTPPMAPVLLVADSELQENEIPDAGPHIPKMTLPKPPQGDLNAIAELARWLAAAESPVIVADRAARTEEGMGLLVELAGELQAPVVDQYSRLNFPNRHPLNQSHRSHAAIAEADLVLGLEVADFWGAVNTFSAKDRTSRRIVKPGTKLVSISAGDLFTKANYQAFQRFTERDLAIAADAEASLPALIEEVRRQLTPARKAARDARGARLATLHQQAQDKIRADAAYAWDAVPIATARLAAEIWDAIRNEDWSLVSYVSHFSSWPLRLWSFEKHYQFIGGPGGFGEGYGAPAAVGAALANRKHGRLSVNIQTDGDLLYGPTVLWTAAHHRIPILNIMHNNRAYHAEVMAVQRLANRRERGIDRTGIGTLLEDPHVDFSKLAQSLGLYAEGPITDPRDLGGAIRRAIRAVKAGAPALLDVVTQPR
jgi:thiamine pyrophosphate-dependent acetolactate synthase large subunit-like protein